MSDFSEKREAFEAALNNVGAVVSEAMKPFVDSLPQLVDGFATLGVAVCEKALPDDDSPVTPEKLDRAWAILRAQMDSEQEN